MKRILTVWALLLATVSLFAAKPLKVVNGSLDVLKENVNATFTLDVSQASFENKQDFKSWSGADYDLYVQRMNDSFFQFFNKYSNGMKLVEEEAPYNVVLDIRLFEEKMGANFGQFSIRIDGTVSVVDKASGEVVCQIAIAGLKGAADFVSADRFPKTMDTLCKSIFKLK